MNTLLNDEQLDIVMKAAVALDIQGERSWSDNIEGYCAYRGDEAKKHKCIIGHMIPDHLYKPEMEGVVFAERCPVVECGVRRNFPFKDAIPAFDKPDEDLAPQLQLLIRLQEYHDDEHRWEKDREDNPNAMQDYVKKMVEVV